MTYLRILLAWALLLGEGAPSFANFAMSPSGTTTAFAIDASNQGTSLCAAASTECGAVVPINTAGSPLFTSGTPGVVNATLQASATTAIGKIDPNTIATWGLAAVTQNVSAPTNGMLGLCQFTTSPATISTTNVSPLQCTTGNSLLVNVTNANANGQATAANSSPVVEPVLTNGGAAVVKGGVGVVNGGSNYLEVAASSTATVLQTSTGAAGDYLSHCVIYPATTGAGAVTVFDNTNSAANNVIQFVSGTLSNLAPIAVPVGAVSVNGAWKVTTGTNVAVVCFGKFS